MRWCSLPIGYSLLELLTKSKYFPKNTSIDAANHNILPVMIYQVEHKLMFETKIILALLPAQGSEGSHYGIHMHFISK